MTTEVVLGMPGLITFSDFQRKGGEPRAGKGGHANVPRSPTMAAWPSPTWDGRLDAREGRNPYVYELDLFAGRSGEMGNWFQGVPGGLAVFCRALREYEMEKCAL